MSKTFREFISEAQNMSTSVIIGMIKHIATNTYGIKSEYISKAPNWIQIPIGKEKYDDFVKKLKTKSFADQLSIEETGGLTKSVKITISK